MPTTTRFCRMTAVPVIRIEEAGLGPEAQVRLVLSGLDDLDRLHRPWASSGATIERVGERMRATTTVEALTRAVGRTLGKDAAAEMDRILRDAVEAWSGPSLPVALPDGSALATDGTPLVMGVVNVTPDSFSDGGTLYPDDHPNAAIAYGRRLIEEGADLLDVGGESTRPHAEAVDETEEIRRVVPVVEGLAGLGVPISVDTSKVKVADAALGAGAVIVNDVSGGADPTLLALVAETRAAYVLMHTRGTPRDMASLAVYDDVVAEVYEQLAAGLRRCEEAGIDPARTIVDPGLGFAKTAAHNLELLAGLRELRSLGRPVLVGASRKSFLGAILDSDDPTDRVEASIACAVTAVSAGAAIVRAHDVKETVRAVRVAAAISAAR
jgi:dihydropteroate synthase